MKRMVLVLVVFFSTLPFLVFAQEMDVQPIKDKSEIISHVNVQESRIVSQNGNNVEVSFSLINGDGAQSDVRYSVAVIDPNGKKIFQKISDEKMTLAENTKIDRTISFEAPNYFFGEKTVWVLVENESGMPMSSGIAGKVFFKNANVPFIKIREETCKLYIKGLPENYTPRQGVDIAPNQGVDIASNEDLYLSCETLNSFDRNVEVEANFQTFNRSLYGEKLAEKNVSVDTVFTPKSMNQFDVLIPKLDKSQAYDVLVNFVENGQVISNTISVHYVVQGESASISNVQLDKTVYMKGENASASFIIGAAADGFLGSRSGKMGSAIYYNLAIVNEKKEQCIEPVKHGAISTDSMMSTVTAKIVTDCVFPQVVMSIENESGKILVEKKYDFTPAKNEGATNGGVQEEQKSDGFSMKKIGWIVIGIISLIAFAIIAGFVIKKRMTPLWILLICGGFFVGGHVVYAETIGFYSRGASTYCEFTVSPTVASPGQQVTVTVSGCRTEACGNDFWGEGWVTGSRVHGGRDGGWSQQMSYYNIMVDQSYCDSYGEYGCQSTNSYTEILNGTEFGSLQSCSNELNAATTPTENCYETWWGGWECTTAYVSAYGGNAYCAQPTVWMSYGTKSVTADASCGGHAIPVQVRLRHDDGSTRAIYDANVWYTTTNCCAPNGCAASTCAGQTCWDGCAAQWGTKLTNGCAASTCAGQTCWDGCSLVAGTKTCCTPNNSACAASTCTGQTCWDGCSTIAGTKTSDNTCATDTCIGKTCWDGCKNVTGTKSCCSDAPLPPNGSVWCSGDTEGLPLNTLLPWEKKNGATDASCTSSRKCEYYIPPQCGGQNTVRSNVLPTSNLCNAASTPNTVTYDMNGDWKWICSHVSENTAKVDCKAPSCLSAMPFKLQSQVYFDEDGRPNDATMSDIKCQNVCCSIDGQDDINPDPNKKSVCTNQTGKVKVTKGASGLYDASCWYDMDGNEKLDSEQVVKFNDLPIQTMCASRSCNGQKKCQTTPKAAAEATECSQTCSSDADCSGGKMIETRP